METKRGTTYERFSRCVGGMWISGYEFPRLDRGIATTTWYRLNKWATRKKKDNKQAIHKFQNRLNELYEADVDDTVLGEIIEAKLAINLEVDKREIHWEQRGRTNWLRFAIG
ncbi:hypothetical protein GOBAR_AA13725 [Gossypium barbadense]|uniref:Uncharacterized protein n=1 Tax=Gossypium barbadense TaxID=3634 RepID=A0A2P5XUB0_GOSBA|nr:hypothetical protein GOBAR_AA13725 [Gossypium barbadense]